MRITAQAMAVLVAMVFTFHTAAAQSSPSAKPNGEAKPVAKTPAAKKAAAPAAGSAKEMSLSDTIKAAEDALGMLRNVNRVDAINTMEFWGTGAPGAAGQDAAKMNYHAAFGYAPPGMRVDTSSVTAKGAKQRTIQEVNDKYAWDASEIGAGFETVNGTVTPAMAAFDERFLQLWTLPYGALKAAVAAGDKASMSKENGATVITFPLSGRLESVTERVTLGPKNLVAKVETKTTDPARASLVTESDYSAYADLGEIKSDVMFPGRIVKKQGGKMVLDIRVTKVDPNNPYIIFPTPDKVMQAAQ